VGTGGQLIPPCFSYPLEPISAEALFAEDVQLQSLELFHSSQIQGEVVGGAEEP
jgi:hypothetical protein